MAKDKRKKRDEANDPQKSDSGKKREKDTGSKKKPALDLDKLKNTTATQVPKSSSTPASSDSAPSVTGIGGPVRTRVVSSGGPKMDWKFSIIASVVASFIGLAAHIFCINGGLVLYDRFNLAYILSKPLMDKVSQKILMDMLGLAPLSQPWLKSSFISQFGEYGLNFMWYHVANVFSHAFTTFLVFFYVLTMARHLHHQNRLKLNPHHLACATAVLFACHPLASESIAYLSARSSLIGTNNYFLSLNFFLWAALTRQPFARGCFTILALMTGAMSIWSNPECMTLPLVALFSLLLIKRPLASWQQTLQEHPFMSGTVMALALIIPCLGLLGIQHTTAVSLFTQTLKPMAYIGTQFQALIFYYLRLFVVPFGMSIDPPLAFANSLTDPLAMLAIIAIVGLIYLGFTKIKEPILGLASLLLLCGFLPHICLVQPDAVADWVAYMPLSGAMIFAGYGLTWMAQRNMKNAIIILSCLTLLFFDLSVFRDSQWASTFTLWETASQMKPESALAHASLSIEQLKRGEIEEAEKEAELAIKLNPDLVLGRVARAKVLLAQGKPFEAKVIFDAALRSAESQNLSIAARGECKLGQLHCLILEGREKEGNALLNRIWEELSGDPKIVYLVGLAKLQQKNWQEAARLFDHTVSTDPTLVEALPPLVQAAFELRNYQLAHRAAAVYMQNNDCVNSRLWFARAAILSKEDAEAEDALKQILVRQPKNAKVLYVLSRMYKHRGKLEEAKKYRADAIAAEPDIVTKFAMPELDAEESGITKMEPPASETKSGAEGSTSTETGTDTGTEEPARPMPGAIDISTGAQKTKPAPEVVIPSTVPEQTPPPSFEVPAKTSKPPETPAKPATETPIKHDAKASAKPAAKTPAIADPKAPAKPAAKTPAKADPKAPAKAAPKAPAKPAAKSPAKPEAKASAPATKPSTTPKTQAKTPQKK